VLINNSLYFSIAAGTFHGITTLLKEQGISGCYKVSPRRHHYGRSECVTSLVVSLTTGGTSFRL